MPFHVRNSPKRHLPLRSLPSAPFIINCNAGYLLFLFLGHALPFKAMAQGILETKTKLNRASDLRIRDETSQICKAPPKPKNFRREQLSRNLRKEGFDGGRNKIPAGNENRTRQPKGAGKRRRGKSRAARRQMPEFRCFVKKVQEESKMGKTSRKSPGVKRSEKTFPRRKFPTKK